MARGTTASWFNRTRPSPRALSLLQFPTLPFTRQGIQLPLDPVQSRVNIRRERGRRTPTGYAPRGETRIVLPPVDSDLLGFVYRADEQTYLDRQQLDIREVNFDITCNDQAFVEDAVEDIDQSMAA